MLESIQACDDALAFLTSQRQTHKVETTAWTMLYRATIKVERYRDRLLRSLTSE